MGVYMHMGVFNLSSIDVFRINLLLPLGDGGDWDWVAIKKNVGRFGIVQFHSTDDCFIPAEEARHVAQQLGSAYHEYTDKNHFFEPFPELINVLKENLSRYINS